MVRRNEPRSQVLFHVRPKIRGKPRPVNPIELGVHELSSQRAIQAPHYYDVYISHNYMLRDAADFDQSHRHAALQRRHGVIEFPFVWQFKVKFALRPNPSLTDYQWPIRDENWQRGRIRWASHFVVFR